MECSTTVVCMASAMAANKVFFVRVYCVDVRHMQYVIVHCGSVVTVPGSNLSRFLHVNNCFR